MVAGMAAVVRLPALSEDLSRAAGAGTGRMSGSCEWGDWQQPSKVRYSRVGKASAPSMVRPLSGRQGGREREAMTRGETRRISQDARKGEIVFPNGNRALLV